MTQPWPSELRLNPARNTLTTVFDNGERFVLPAEYLRVESPSAEVRGHGPGQKQIVRGKHAVTIDTLEPVGNYAVRILFDDGHDTGLYSWDYLYKLGREHKTIWAAYLTAAERS
ncbi:MAG TPA: DUF971 domain-containing protein [Rhizomicrobium sp.]|jgi:DUF971 family protein|nr:DUF971 domain-containing protein [Rhizomicrobium sp.]